MAESINWPGIKYYKTFLAIEMVAGKGFYLEHYK